LELPVPVQFVEFPPASAIEGHTVYEVPAVKPLRAMHMVGNAAELSPTVLKARF
jgi:hypothetical protein